MENIESMRLTSTCGPFENKVNADGHYLLNPGEGQRQIHADASLLVDCVKSSIVKVADKEFAVPGDIIHYTVTFTNQASVYMYKVKIRDTIPTMTTLIESSINPAPQPGETLKTGITIGNVAIGESKTLEFDVTINTDAVGKIINTATESYYFKDNNNVEHHVDSQSDSTVVTILKPHLLVTKTSDKAYAFCGDELIFTLTIINDGDVKIESILVVDTLPSGMTYKPHSTIKNNIPPYTNENPEDGINIGNLKPGEIYTIQFTTIVSCP